MSLFLSVCFKNYSLGSFVVFLFCFLNRERKKGMELGAWRDEKDLEGVGGGKSKSKYII